MFKLNLSDLSRKLKLWFGENYYVSTRVDKEEECPTQ